MITRSRQGAEPLKGCDLLTASGYDKTLQRLEMIIIVV